ncbi:hypothetical protein ACSBR2_027728 [Camellia fascicularis]
MKTEMKIKPYHLRFSFVLLLMILLHFCVCRAASAKKSNSMISGDQCNATIAECFADEGEGEEELLMESEMTRRVASNQKFISLGTLGRPPVCKTTIYDNCIGQANNYKQSCTTYNRCKHSSG